MAATDTRNQQSRQRRTLAAIREETPAGSVIQYSDYELETVQRVRRRGGVDRSGVHAGAEAQISIFDTGFGRSDLTYTVAHVWHGNIFRLGDHLDRLLDGARRLRLDPGTHQGRTRGRSPGVRPSCLSSGRPTST